MPSLVLNRRPQILQENGVSPVWILSCRDTKDGALNFFEQKRQPYLLLVPSTSCGGRTGKSKMRSEKNFTLQSKQ